MKGLPYLPLYVGDFLRSTMGWTFFEQAVLLRLLMAQWEIGTLPLEVGRLAAIAGVDHDQLMEVWPQVVRRFIETDAGYVNEDLEAHRENYRAYCRKQSENGRKGGRATWKTKSNVVEFPKGGGNDSAA